MKNGDPIYRYAYTRQARHNKLYRFIRISNLEASFRVAGGFNRRPSLSSSVIDSSNERICENYLDYLVEDLERG